MPAGHDLITLVASSQDSEDFQKRHWSGSFEQYLDIVTQRPEVCRTAFQRIYDVIVASGTEEIYQNKEKLIRYQFFDDPIEDGRDAIFGLVQPLMSLVNVLKSAAQRYGIERRVLLLHGPVGSSKSTIVRLLKKGLEAYSRTDAGALYTFSWKDDTDPAVLHSCPMHEEPLHLVPIETRPRVLAAINRLIADPAHHVLIEGDLCPFCRQMYTERMERYHGDWNRMIRDVVVRRLILSEQDRIGIGTFQPKDEKNQDSTELTGDINYRKIAEYGTDSDPRAFNFDGEFNVANRGLVEFIEVLKLDVAFLYDLLGASQEHKIKPKKFAQTDIDEVIVGHSVAGNTPIPYRSHGVPGWTTLERLFERFEPDPSGLEVLAHDFAAGRTCWTPVKAVFRHRFSGPMLTTAQAWGVVETTPNHSIYDRHGRTFYPPEQHDVMAIRRIEDGFAVEGEIHTVDVIEGVDGFVRDEASVVAGGGRRTGPGQPGWAGLGQPRHGSAVRALYDPICDAEALKDLITVLVWYAAAGHVDGRNGGIVIRAANRDELERVGAASARITSGAGARGPAVPAGSAGQLDLGSPALAHLAKDHCGEHAVTKRLPDFLFRLPPEFLEHGFDELMRTAAADRAKGFRFRTVSPLLAAQAGTLATLLGLDYGVSAPDRPGQPPAYHLRFEPQGEHAGRRAGFEPRLAARAAEDEWVYDIECIGLHNFVCGVGNIVASNTNEPEYRKLQSNEFMEALRDRTVKIDVPYVTKLDDEIKIYEKDYNLNRVRGKHLAPHTLAVAAMWAVLTRLEEPKNASLSLLQKLKLYNGKTLPGFTEDNIKELREAAEREGMHGISPRYVQDKVSNALVAHPEETCVNPFMVLNELEAGLKHHSLITGEEQRKHFRQLLIVVKDEYEDIVKNEVQRAIAADDEALTRLCGNYIDNVKAYTQREKVRNKYTGQYQEADERLMRSVEEKIDIPESRKDDFRREIMNYIGALAIDGKRFDYKTNERLQKALELKLFEDQKDTIKLTSLVSRVVDRDTQAKIDVVKGRLIQQYGYCEVCATDVLNFVASIFARGDVKKGHY